MKKIKLILKLLILKCKIIWKIIRHDGSFCVLYVSKFDMGRLIIDDKVNDVKASYYRMMEYQMRQLVKNVGEQIDSTELICDKAQFMANVEEKIKQTV